MGLGERILAKDCNSQRLLPNESLISYSSFAQGHLCQLSQYCAEPELTSLTGTFAAYSG